MENGDYDGAVKDLNEALSKSKNSIPMTIRVYETFADNGHEQEGQSYLSSAIENRLDAMTDYEKVLSIIIARIMKMPATF